MSDEADDAPRCPHLSRRGFLGALAGAATAGYGARMLQVAVDEKRGIMPHGEGTRAEPFYGEHQSGIATSPQMHTYFAAFDLTAKTRAEVIAMLKAWTLAGARMASGQPSTDLPGNPEALDNDSAEALGLPTHRLTLTFGFGAGLFDARYGLAALRPEALVDLPRFNGDQLVPERTGGDITVQACADDPQVAFHAVRQLARLAEGKAVLRWTQSGFIAKPPGKETPRNLMGFRDGTESPAAQRPKENNPAASKHGVRKGLDEVVWAGNEGPAWMNGGSYMVVRRIRMALEHWDNTEVSFQEQVIGRRKYSGAPLSGKDEFDELDLEARDASGNFVIAEDAHVRLASSMTHDGAQMLRRGYSYNDGVNITAERWPPWRQGLEYDAGLFFMAYQRDPRTGFIKVFEKMARLDALNQFVTHTGGGLFACPPGARKGGYIGQGLFEAA